MDRAGFSPAEADLQVRGTVFDIKRYAVHDGPGIRTTVFLKGCPLDCRWCHNPEAKSGGFQLSFKESRCLKCGECVEACTHGALTLEKRLHVDRDLCRICGDCAQVCPTEALEIIGRETSVGELMAEIEKDRVFFEESGGGVTFSGGEPLMQPEFLEALLRSCRKGHIHTCLDTCGQAPWDVLERMIPLVDIFLYDLKSVSSALHARETGLSNELILRNLRRLAGKGRAIVIRIPLIPGINDAPEEIDAMGEFIKRLEGVRDVSLLPFHDIAGEKYRRLGTPSPLADLKPQPQKRVEEIKGRMESFGFNVKIGS